MIKLNEISFVYPDLSGIFVPFISLIVLIIGMIGTTIYFAILELKNKGEK